jgi:hypothetical protein
MTQEQFDQRIQAMSDADVQGARAADQPFPAMMLRPRQIGSVKTEAIGCAPPIRTAGNIILFPGPEPRRKPSCRGNSTRTAGQSHSFLILGRARNAR